MWPFKKKQPTKEFKRPEVVWPYDSDEWEMSFSDYEDQMLPLRRYPNVGNNYVYPALGLAGEAGEVANKVKKVLRDDDSVLTEERREALIDEVGDVLWYVAAMANELGISLEHVARTNLDKLLNRNERGTIHGDGDDR